jgi:general secretion pathway protein I
VLAALVIVSLGMLGVIQAVSQTVSNSGYLRDKTLAHWVAMNRVTEARLQSSAPPVEETSGEVDMAGQRWRWTMNVAKTAVENVRRIDVKVARAEADKKSSLASITGFFGATVAPPGTALIVWDASPATAPGTTTPGGTVPGGLTIGSTPTPTPTPKP